MKIRNGWWEVIDVKEDVEGDQLGHDAPIALPGRGGLGTDEPAKTDVFSEKFQMAFDPPPPLPHFRKIILRFFQEYMT